MAWKVEAVVQEPGSSVRTRLEYETHNSLNTARSRLIQASRNNGVWEGGPSGPRRRYYHASSVVYWEIKEV